MTDLTTLPELAVAWRVSVRTVQRWLAQDQAAGHPAVRRCRRRGRVYLRADDADRVLLRRYPSLE